MTNEPKPASVPVPRVLGGLPPRAGGALYVFACGCATLGTLGALAAVTGSPWIFPSLGPTAYLFFATPSLPTAAPRNALLGHAIGLACGWTSLALFGLLDAPPAYATGVDAARAAAAALSLGATGALMVLAHTPHPPAGATTLIVSLGVMTRPAHLAVIEAAVGLLTLEAILIQRWAGVPFPLWGPTRHASDMSRSSSVPP